MNTVAEESKKFFRTARYMDDVLCIYAESTRWDHEAFLKYQGEECYMPPLKLEAAGSNVFLETEFEIKKDGIQHRLKNVNEEKGAPKVWRYQHYDSYGSYVQKKGVLLGCLRKVDKMASDRKQLLISGRRKMAEFERLGYPAAVRRYACSVVARDSGNGGWIVIRNEQH